MGEGFRVRAKTTFLNLDELYNTKVIKSKLRRKLEFNEEAGGREQGEDCTQQLKSSFNKIIPSSTLVKVLFARVEEKIF
jgi:hypothetical protein